MTRRVCDYIETHLDEKMRLDGLAALAGLAAAGEVRASHRGGGCGPVAYCAPCAPAYTLQYQTTYQQVRRVVYECQAVTTEQEVTQTYLVPVTKTVPQQRTVLVQGILV